LAPPFDVRQALDAVGADVLSGSGVRDAVADLLRKGLPDADGRPGRGLNDLRARAERLRREVMRRGRLDGAVTRARAQLDQALAAETDALDVTDSPDADFARARLDALPRSPAAAVRELTDYRWTSPAAAEIYRQLLAGIRNDVIDQQFRGIRDALLEMQPGHRPESGTEPGTQAGSPDADAAAAQAVMQAMLTDLNKLLDDHRHGRDTPEDFTRFMATYGQLFPENPEDIDALIDLLARRSAAAQRLMASLNPQQRDELAQLMDAAAGPANGLTEQMTELGQTLRQLRPDLEWDQGARFQGSQPLEFQQAASALQELAELDAAIEALGQDHPGATLDDIDVDAVERTMGTAAANDVRALQNLERELERQGWVTRGGDGLQLSPKALRRLGHTALNQVFARSGGVTRGGHDVRSAGSAGEATGASRRWEFGDEQPLDVVRTVGNAARRHLGSAGTRQRIELDVDDFEVIETERRSSAAVALCVDLSYSMISEGRWAPMKQTALALAHLIATRYPQDALQIIGFGRYAAPVTVEHLAGLEPDYVQGTNLQHALTLTGRHLRRHPGSEPVVLVVTDGEPTAHLRPDGEAVFSWPPASTTVSATIAEVDALTRMGAAINVFMLGEDPGLRRFMAAVARRNGGRVFTPDTDQLGRYVVDDYVRSRSGRRR
jgi:uncharacterized protein with von Willebrand factor type A (vWA) domain